MTDLEKLLRDYGDVAERVSAPISLSEVEAGVGQSSVVGVADDAPSAWWTRRLLRWIAAAIALAVAVVGAVALVTGEPPEQGVVTDDLEAPTTTVSDDLGSRVATREDPEPSRESGTEGVSPGQSGAVVVAEFRRFFPEVGVDPAVNDFGQLVHIHAWRGGFALFRPFADRQVNLWTSRDGLAWTRRADVTFPFVWNRILGDGTRIAFEADDGTLAVTTDLEEWEIIDTDVLIEFSQAGPEAAAIGPYGWAMTFRPDSDEEPRDSTVVSARWGEDPVAHEFSGRADPAISAQGVLVLDGAAALWFFDDGQGPTRRQPPIEIGEGAGRVFAIDAGALLQVGQRLYLGDSAGLQWTEIDLTAQITEPWSGHASAAGFAGVVAWDPDHAGRDTNILFATENGQEWLVQDVGVNVHSHDVAVGNGVVLVRRGGEILRFALSGQSQPAPQRFGPGPLAGTPPLVFTPAPDALLDDAHTQTQGVWFQDALWAIRYDVGDITRTLNGFDWEVAARLDQLKPSGAPDFWRLVVTDHTIASTTLGYENRWFRPGDREPQCWTPGSPLAEIATSQDGRDWKYTTIEADGLIRAVAARGGCARTGGAWLTASRDWLVLETGFTPEFDEFSYALRQLAETHPDLAWQDMWLREEEATSPDVRVFEVDGERVEVPIDGFEAARRSFNAYLVDQLGLDGVEELSRIPLLFVSRDGRNWTAVATEGAPLSGLARYDTDLIGGHTHGFHARYGTDVFHTTNFEAWSVVDQSNVRIMSMGDILVGVGSQVREIGGSNQLFYKGPPDTRYGAWIPVGPLGLLQANHLNTDFDPELGPEPLELTLVNQHGSVTWEPPELNQIGDYEYLHVIGAGEDFLVVSVVRNTSNPIQRDVFIGRAP